MGEAVLCWYNVGSPLWTWYEWFAESTGWGGGTGAGAGAVATGCRSGSLGLPVASRVRWYGLVVSVTPFWNGPVVIGGLSGHAPGGCSAPFALEGPQPIFCAAELTEAFLDIFEACAALPDDARRLLGFPGSTPPAIAGPEPLACPTWPHPPWLSPDVFQFWPLAAWDSCAPAFTLSQPFPEPWLLLLSASQPVFHWSLF